jgi:putative CocE/NonD family hydrolase
MGVVVSVLAVVAALVPALPAAAESADEYGVATESGVGVTMADGTVLRADLLRPAVEGTTTPAQGNFPVLITQTPYGRAGQRDETYFVQRGYIVAVVDVRGTGGSGGEWLPFSAKEADDGAQLVRWAAALPGSTGKVGLEGASYRGINQLTTAAAVGPNSPLKAIFPMVAGNDLMRDLASMGGFPNVEFMPLWYVTNGLESVTAPLLDALTAGSPVSVLTTALLVLQHLGALSDGVLPMLTGQLNGGEQAFDDDFWQSRNPVNSLAKVVANGIPAYLVGGWNDLFQRGQLMNYSGLQNAWAGRPVGAPMAAGQPVTGRYQLLMGPWTHASQVDHHPLELAWYDHWLKGVENGIAGTASPLHANVLGTDKWIDTTTYPFAGAAANTFYLGSGRTGTSPASKNDGSLSTTVPAQQGDDRLDWALLNSTCTRSTNQWIGGLLTNPSCDTNDLDREQGPNAVVYTSAPLTTAATVAGPISATIYATANTKETAWVVTVSDVGPDGSSRPFTEGALAGSMRDVDPSQSWYASDGHPLMPYHPYTKASEHEVKPGELTRYDVEVFPALTELAAGHRLRVTITTADTPHLAPRSDQLPNLLGGEYHLETGGPTPSSITIPLTPAY